MADITDITKAREALQAKMKADKKRIEEGPLKDILGDASPIPATQRTRLLSENESTDLKLMNANYAFVHSVGGKAAIMARVYNELYKREIYEFISPENLNYIWANKVAKETTGGKAPPQNMAKWWLTHEHRKDYATVTFEPD